MRSRPFQSSLFLLLATSLGACATQEKVEREARVDKPLAPQVVQEPLNPFSQSTLRVRIKNAHDVGNHFAGYKRAVLYGKPAYVDSEIEVQLYPYKYTDGEYEIRVSLEGMDMESFQGEFYYSKSLIPQLPYQILPFNYKEKPEIETLLTSHDPLWNLNIDLYRTPCGSHEAEAIEQRTIVVDMSQYYADPSPNLPSLDTHK